MTHPIDKAMREHEDAYYAAVQAMLKMLDSLPEHSLRVALEEAIEVWNTEQED